MLGGIKAVVWTDVLQGSITLLSLIVVALLGVYKVGGFTEVFSRVVEGGRLNVNTTFDLTTRATLWNCFISGLFQWTSHIGFNQSCVQRVVALPSLRHAQISLTIFVIGLVAVMGSVFLTGFVVFAIYADCDPIKTGDVEKADKIVPYFVQNIAGHITGMSGLFIACVFSAALSTISANLNSLSGIIYFDYIRPRIQHTEEKANFIMKCLVVLTGIYCIASGLVVERFQSILQFCLTISGVAFGSLFGVFMMGILVPKAHSKPTYIALIISLIVPTIIAISGKINVARGTLRYDPLPTSTEACTNYNITAQDIYNTRFNSLPEAPAVHPLDISKMSFQWYVVVGSLLVWVIAIPLSYIMKPEKTEQIDPKLYAPIVQKFLPKEMELEYSEVPLNEKGDPLEFKP